MPRGFFGWLKTYGLVYIIIPSRLRRCYDYPERLHEDRTGCARTAARNKNGSLMTDSGLSRVSGFHVKRKGRKRIPCRAFAAVREGALPAL